MVTLHCQPNWIQNHHGNTSLGALMRVVLESIWREGDEPSSAWTAAAHGLEVRDWIKRRISPASELDCSHSCCHCLISPPWWPVSPQWVKISPLSSFFWSFILSQLWEKVTGALLKYRRNPTLDVKCMTCHYMSTWASPCLPLEPCEHAPLHLHLSFPPAEGPVAPHA